MINNRNKFNKSIMNSLLFFSMLFTAPLSYCEPGFVCSVLLCTCKELIAPKRVSIQEQCITQQAMAQTCNGYCAREGYGALTQSDCDTKAKPCDTSGPSEYWHW